MKQKYKVILFSLLIAILSFSATYGQVDTLKIISQPQVIQQNAGFDVIIKINGEIIYGIVKEVGLSLISYKRTDIPDGPIYTMLRSDVHAISYRNQVTEYFNTLTVTPVIPVINVPSRNPKINNIHNALFEHGTVRLGIGIIKSFTKVDNSKNYSSSTSFPAINVGYDVDFKNQVRLGLQVGFGSRNFSKQEYSSYDSVQNNITLKENIFALFLYAKYNLMQKPSRLKPYIIGGLGINSSRINSENTIRFTNNNSQALLVKSGTRSTGLGVMARVGADYFINDQFQLFLDAGIGTAIINFGLAINLK